MVKDFVSEQVVEYYDEHIRQLIPGYALVHQHIQAILHAKFQPQPKKVLIIGCGTGFELAYLLSYFPTWQYVACDFSPTMLEKAQAHIQAMELATQVDFICGDFSEYYDTAEFDLVLSVLVTHFVPYVEKHTFFANIANVLKKDGMFLTFDLMKFHYQSEASVLQYICEQQGLSTKQSTAMLARLNDDYAVMSDAETRAHFEEVGFNKTEKFIQLAGYSGFYAFKG